MNLIINDGIDAVNASQKDTISSRTFYFLEYLTIFKTTIMTEDSKQSASEGGLMSSAWSLGAAAWNYASQTVSRYVSTREILFH